MTRSSAPPNAYILEDIDGGHLIDLEALVEPFVLEDGEYRRRLGGDGLVLDAHKLREHRRVPVYEPLPPLPCGK